MLTLLELAPLDLTAVDLGLTAAIGFLGSFGHCVGMCGPVATAFALSVESRPVEPRPVDLSL